MSFKLLMENWRKFLSEDTRAFHGYKMDPVKMRVPACDKGDNPSNPSDQWESNEEGCPKFTDDRNIGDDHEDAVEAVSFIENVKPSRLIAYSRGGAVASLALNKSQHKPELIFVAPAWKRDWVDGNPLPPSGLKGVIIHGTKDNAVPLRHSFEMAAATGMPLYVVPEKNHISVLKHKEEPEAGLPISPRALEAGLKELPEWTSGLGSEEEVEKQHQFIEKIKQK